MLQVSLIGLNFRLLLQGQEVHVWADEQYQKVAQALKMNG
jgi:hypothetical protein